MRRLLLAMTGALLAAVVCASPAAALDDGLARTPPMGWNGWYAFGCRNNERNVRAQVRALLRSGMAYAGYRYVNLDDCWMARTRGPDGALRADRQTFPSGIAALARYVHSHGLKLGIYLSTGYKTCANRPGSYLRLEQDAATVAAWGVDLVKLDWCWMEPGTDPRPIYTTMRDALRATGRPIVLSISEWGDGRPWTWAGDVGHMWRTAHDLPNHDRRSRWNAVLRVVSINANLWPVARPGSWNDPDILNVGLGLTPREGRTTFALWSMMAAPLLAGSDLTRMDRATRGTFLNREVIRVDQDPAGVPGLRWFTTRGRDVWIRPLYDGARAVLFVNRTGRTRHFLTDMRGLFRPGGRPTRHRRFRVRDLWAHQTRVLGPRLEIDVSPHGAAMFRVYAL